jgi:hypothetical protein
MERGIRLQLWNASGQCEICGFYTLGISSSLQCCQAQALSVPLHHQGQLQQKGIRVL